MIELGNKRQLFSINALLHQGHVPVRPVVANAELLLAILEHNLGWLQRKAILGYAINASYMNRRRYIDLLLSFDFDIEAIRISPLNIWWHKHELDVEVWLVIVQDTKGRFPKSKMRATSQTPMLAKWTNLLTRSQ